MTVPESERARVVAEANRAPSVHNIQPTRWRFEAEGVHLRLDPARALPVGDRENHDAAFSLGCALEATRIALGRRGFGTVVEHGQGASARLRLRRATAQERERAEIDAATLARRGTHRLGFAPASEKDGATLRSWAREHPDIVMTTEGADLARLAELNDRASLRFMRDDAYRTELLGWMRLKRDDGRPDGLDASALGMSRLEAAAASTVLRRAPFRVLDRLGLAAALTSEREPTLRAAAIAAVTIPDAAPRPRADVEVGAAFLRLDLALTALGFRTWPMGVLTDEAEARSEAARVLGAPDDRRLRLVFRVGRPKGITPTARRMVAEALIDPTPAP